MTEDNRRGWIVVAATFLTLVVLYGAWYSYSVFLVALLHEFGWSRSLLSGAFSVFVLVHGGFGPVIGWLLRRAGPRRVIMAGGCIMGVGLCLTAETTAWWHLYVAFGGIAAVGVGLAGWIPAVVLIRGWFPYRVGWRWAFRILAILIVGWVVPATLALVRDPPIGKASEIPPDSRTAPAALDAKQHWTLASAIRTWRFWGVAGFYFTGNFVTQMLIIHQVAYLVDHGMHPIAAAAVAGTAGLVSIAGKIGWGILSDRTGREPAYALAFGCVMASIGALGLAGAHPASLLPYLYALLIGLGYAVMAPVPPAVASDLFGGPSFPTIFGALYIVTCLGLATGTWSAGEIFDRTGSYAGALWLGVGMAILSPILLYLAAPRRPNPPPMPQPSAIGR
ncbi:MAG TPA: MFS transporter [Candidatus Acidoferrum sp.]|nr:MFS transporter [Candidatus Acidoferrum sp.]